VKEAFELFLSPLKYPDGVSVGTDVQTSWNARMHFWRFVVTSTSMAVSQAASDNILQCGYTYTVGARRVFIKNNKVVYGSSVDTVDCEIVCATPTKFPTTATESPTTTPTTTPTPPTILHRPTTIPTESPTESPTTTPTESPTTTPPSPVNANYFASFPNTNLCPRNSEQISVLTCFEEAAARGATIGESAECKLMIFCFVYAFYVFFLRGSLLLALSSLPLSLGGMGAPKGCFLDKWGYGNANQWLLESTVHYNTNPVGGQHKSYSPFCRSCPEEAEEGRGSPEGGACFGQTSPTTPAPPTQFTTQAPTLPTSTSPAPTPQPENLYCRDCRDTAPRSLLFARLPCCSN
jgi:hypothetical protein